MNEKKYYYFTVLSNWILGFDKYSNTYSKINLSESTFPNKFFMLNIDQQQIGLIKAQNLLKKLNIQNDQIIRLEIKLKDNQIPIKHDRGWFLNQNYIIVELISILNNSTFENISFEETTAKSYQLKNNLLKSYQELRPRSVSILPIANACQAKCWFCFSESSISIEKEKNIFNLDHLHTICKKGKSLGAARFVITGGGEPTLLDHQILLKIIKIAKQYFDKIILISNGFEYSKLSEEFLISRLNDLATNGLSILSISRHHHNLEKNKEIMGITIETDRIFNAISKHNIPLKTRLICVLQKKGIANNQDIDEYIKFSKSMNISQICFKELYVSSQIESIYANKKENYYSEKNQIPLDIVIQHLKSQNYIKTAKLPWGSPIFTKDGIEVACYTEPSVGWERLHGTARSWNIMSDGKIYASLEDLKSEIKDIL